MVPQDPPFNLAVFPDRFPCILIPTSNEIETPQLQRTEVAPRFVPEIAKSIYPSNVNLRSHAQFTGRTLHRQAYFSFNFGRWNADRYFMEDLNSKMNESVPPPVGVRKRRSERVLLRIPIEVKGIDEGGKAFKEVSTTLVINRGGARISLKRTLRVDARITITNLQTQISCPFRVVGMAGHTHGEGPECRVECLKEELNLWGIIFPEKKTTIGVEPAEQESIDALLECSVCHARELAPLTPEKYHALSSRLFLSRNCTHCGVPTAWKFAFIEADRGAAPALQVPQAAASSKGKEHRRAKRLTVKIPIRIRVSDGGGEITRTENLSKTGVCFISSRKMQVGEVIKITVGYEPGKNESEISARVAWVRPQEGTSRTIYGVQLEDSG